MIVRFTKGAPGAPDAMTCLDGDQSHTVSLPREGVLPVAAIQFVVEQTLGFTAGRFGAGWKDARSAKKPAPASVEARQSTLVAQRLQAQQWSGGGAPEAFVAEVAEACRRAGVPVPKLGRDDVDRLRTAVREFGAAWRPLAPGASLERTFTPETTPAPRAKPRR